MPFVKKNNEKQAHSPTDTRKIFIGRTDELHFFAEKILAPEEPDYNIVSISGNGGVGKSTLLARFVEEIRSPHFREYCLSAFVDEQQPTPDAAMEKLAEQLSKAGAPLMKFEKELTRYKEVAHKLQLERENAQDAAIRAGVDILGTVAEGVPGGGLLHKGANLVTDLGLKEYRSRQSVKEAMLLEDPISDLTRVFVEELNRLTDTQIISSSGRGRRSQRIILFLDTFERTASALAPWLLDQFLQANISTNVVLVVAGRDSLEFSLPDDPKRWLPYRDNDVISFISLDSFSEDETRAYLAARGVTDPASTDTIWQLSKGLPLYLGLLTFNLQGVIDPTEGVVANFLRWLPEQDHIKRRLAVDAALFSKPFNQDDLSAFSYLDEHDLEDTYRWLIRLPFVKISAQGGRYRYHEMAQEMFRRYLFQRSQKEYTATTRVLANYYKALLEETKKEGGKEDYTSAAWLEALLAFAYQLFYLPEQSSHIEGCERILYAYKNIKAEQQSEIVRFLQELSCDQTNRLSNDSQNIVKLLLRFSEADMEEQAQKLIEATGDLLEIVSTQAAFSPEVLAWLYRKRGVTRRNLEDYRRALQDFDSAISIASDPMLVRSYIHRGIVYYELKDYERTLQDFDHAFEFDPSNVEALRARGIAHLEFKNYERAIEDFDRVLELDPQNVEACNARGVAYMDLKDYEHAMQDLDRAIELDSTYTWAFNNRGLLYLYLKDYERAIPDLKRGSELDAGNPNSYFNLGNAYYNLKEYQQSVQYFSRGFELHAGTAQVYFQRGLSYSYLKDHQRAIQDFDRAIELDPALLDCYSSRGFAYDSLKDYQRAMQDYDKAFDAGLKTATLYSRRSIVYYELKEYQRAVQELDCAIELEPENIHFYNFRGDAYYYLKQYQRAIQDYDQTIVLDQNYAPAYFGRGDAYLALKDYRRAIQEIDHAISLDPTDARFYHDRGVAYSSLKDYQQAMKDYDRTIELNPDYALAFDNRGFAHYKLNDIQSAIQDLHKAIELEPNRANAYFGLGLAYSWLKDIEQAKANFNHARELSPTDTYSAWMLEWLDMYLKRDDPERIARLEAIAASAPQQTTARVCKGVALWLRGDFEDALSELEQVASLDQVTGEAYFWKAMACASLGHDEEAVAALEQAMIVDIPTPPILFTPLHWLEQDKPDFYNQFALPLLERYHKERE